MFLPTTKKEMEKLGWDHLDVIIVTGDTYIDSPYIGAAVIGKVLMSAGFKVGIIAQPDIKSEFDITRLGEPTLFWGITAGSVDSMVANHTATKKFRKNDDYTPGGKNNRRPDRASIIYSNLIKRFFKNTKPLVLGGIEASLRRIAHYDYWSNSIRKSILLDAKADILIYGMGEKTVVELAQKLKNNDDYRSIRGICYIDKNPAKNYKMLPSFNEVQADKSQFIKMFHQFYKNNDPLNSSGLCQQQDTRFLIQNPPNFYPTTPELDYIYDLDYERDVHPYYKKQGVVKAMDTIKFSITSHRGCYGECNFCSIAIHQGRKIQSRSPKSIVAEAEKISQLPDFRGYILDVGGPTANMYAMDCSVKNRAGSCKGKRCLYPEKCQKLNANHKRQIELLRKIRKVKGIKKVFVNSGIRHDLVLEDIQHGKKYLRELIKFHISGQMKIAPEHTQDNVLKLMGKPKSRTLKIFKDQFNRINKQEGKKQFLTYYFIAAHPGCTYEDMEKLHKFIQKELQLNPEQVQIFTPLPSTYSAVMYYTGLDPFTGKKVFVEKDMGKKEKQKRVVVKTR